MVTRSRSPFVSLDVIGKRGPEGFAQLGPEHIGQRVEHVEPRAFGGS
jgi:hypothetical protein